MIPLGVVQILSAPSVSAQDTKKKVEKQANYQKKQEESGNNVVKYIFAGLILLAIAFVIYSVYIVS